MPIDVDGAFTGMEMIIDYLDHYADVNDGLDGQPVPNKAMQMKQVAEEILAFLDELP